MTHQTTPLRPANHRRTDDLWILGLFSLSGLGAAAFVLFLTFNPNAGKLVSDVVQAEFPLGQPAPEIAAQQPAPAPAQVALGR